MASTKIRRFTVVLCAVASQASLLFGFGYEACALLLGATTAMQEELKMSEEQMTHFTEDTKFVVVFACLLSGFLADLVGRRSALVISGALAFVGYLTMALAVSYGVLITGRIVSVLGIGLGLPVAPVYIAEIAPPSCRGLLNTIPEVLSVLGLWLAVWTRVAIRNLSASSQWRALSGVGIVPSLILGVGMIFLPESPCWLVRRARLADTKSVLQRTLKTSDEVDARLSALREAARIPLTMGDENFDAVPQDIDVLAIWHELRRPLILPQLMKIVVSVFTLHVFQQFSGIDVLTSETLLKFSHDSPVFQPIEYLMEQLLPLCGRLFPLFISLFISDFVGRTLLVFYSLGGVGFSMLSIIMSGALLKYEFGNPRVVGMVNKWSLTAFFASFSIGLGPTTMVHTCEALPFKVRAQVVGLAVAVNRLISIGLYYLKLALDMALEGLLYWIISLLLVLGLVLCKKYIIDTSNESLEELDKDFSPTLELSLGNVVSEG